MIQEIKDFINQNIKENGKGGITGTILNSVLNKIADALPSSASAGLKNLVDGAAEGSVRGVNAAENSETYVIGKNSHAEGTGTKAGGSEDWIENAHAEGRETHAAGNEAHAEGVGTYAWHQGHAEGGYTRAEGGYSHAEGASSVAKGFISHAEGEYTKALSRSCHAEGCYTKAGSEDDSSYSTEAHAEGKNTHADGNQAHAEGYGTYATHQAHAEGNMSRAEAAYSHAEGLQTTACHFGAHAEGCYTQAGGENEWGYNNGYGAHAEGQRTKALADYSHAEGTDTVASKDSAHAEGSNTKASGYQSHAEGSSTIASGNQAHAEGSSTIASGNQAHAEGSSTIASGHDSHAGGLCTVAIGDRQTAIGQYNKEIDAYFSVGDGEYEKRSDAFRVEKDSRVMVKNSAGEEVHLQDFEPRSCIIRWQPQSEIKADGYYYYHDLVYMPFFADIADGETWVARLNWMYEHQVDMDNAELAEGEEAVSYIGAERLCTTITATKMAGFLNIHAFTKVVDSTRNSEDIHQNRFHTPQVRYVWSDTDALSRQSRVYLQDYIFSERYESDKVGTHFRFTIENATLNGKIMPLSNFIFADNTGNVDYSKDENGNAISDSSSINNGYNKDYIDNLSVKVKARCGDVTKESSFQISQMLSNHEITIDVPEQEGGIDNATAAKILKNEENIGFVQNIALESGYYYDLTSSVAGAKSSAGSFACAKIKVYAGDVATVATRGGSNGRAWALTNGNEEILSVAGANADTISNPVELRVEENGYLFINCRVADIENYHAKVEPDKSVQSQIYELKAASGGRENNIPCMYNPPAPLTKEPLRILDLGNSYSDHALEYMPKLLESFANTGYSLYKAYRDSASFKTWYNCYNDSDSAGYSISHVAGDVIEGVEGGGNAGDGAAFRNALNQKWDIVMIHQNSRNAHRYGDWLTNGDAGYLKNLIHTIKKTNPQATIGFLLIHSYRGSYSFNEEGDSVARWQLIADSVIRLRSNFGIDFIIPYGTAIQNLRCTTLSDANEFSSDGTHLSTGLARYTAACCYYQSLFAPRFGSILGHTWRKTDFDESMPGVKNINDENALIGQTAAMLATYNMYEVQNPEGYEI